jgi:hypothetical protein
MAEENSVKREFSIMAYERRRMFLWLTTRGCQYLRFYSGRWPCRVRRGSAAALIAESRFRVPLRAWTFVSCLCCVLCR